MSAFFGDTGSGPSAGIFEDVPRDRPEFRERYQRQIAALAKKRKAEEMI